MTSTQKHHPPPYSKATHLPSPKVQQTVIAPNEEAGLVLATWKQFESNPAPPMQVKAHTGTKENGSLQFTEDAGDICDKGPQMDTQLPTSPQKAEPKVHG